MRCTNTSYLRNTTLDQVKIFSPALAFATLDKKAPHRLAMLTTSILENEVWIK